MLLSSGGIDLKSKRLNRGRSSSFILFKMLHKKYCFLLIQELKKVIRKHLEESFNPGKLSVFSYPGILDSFLNPLPKINWYVHNFTELDHEDFTVSYIVRYAKKAPLAEWQILDYSKKSGSGEYIVTSSYKER